MQIVEKLYWLGLSAVAYASLHEIGHYLTANFFGIDASFVYSSATNSLLNLSMGVHYAGATALQSFLILIGATALPMLFLAAILFGTKHDESGTLKIIAEVFLVLIIFSLLPLPGIPDADGSRIWAAVLSGA